ncbi:F-box only protein 39-like [Lineus longissimus]|uniref:F-box only protein 39-like n=1 Tax=Lineus longissimus TaxID=88925 RepID=UPI00315C5816
MIKRRFAIHSASGMFEVYDSDQQEDCTQNNRSNLPELVPENCSRTDWSNLPELAVIMVMKYLEDSDRGSMAQTCTTWARLVRTAALWRRRHVQLGIDHKSDRKAVQYFEQFAGNLHQLSIACQSRGFLTRFRLKENLAQIISNITEKKPKLRALVINRLGLDRFRKFDVIKTRDRDLVNGMCKMFRGQTRMRVVKLPETYVRLVTGRRLLQALAKGSGPQVATLNLIDFFQHGIAVYRVPNIQKIITSFTNLRKLAINFNCLSEEILLGVAKKTRGRLRHLTVRVHERDPHGHRINGRTWKAVRALCPELQVEFEFDSICT